LAVLLPLDKICTLGSIALEVTLETFNGHKATGRAYTDRNVGDPFLPSAYSVGPTKLFLPMENIPGATAGGIR